MPSDNYLTGLPILIPILGSEILLSENLVKFRVIIDQQILSSICAVKGVGDITQNAGATPFTLSVVLQVVMNWDSRVWDGFTNPSPLLGLFPFQNMERLLFSYKITTSP